MTTVRDTGHDVWVECFPGPIEIAGVDLECPAHLFSLPSWTPFETSDYTHVTRTVTDRRKALLDIRIGAEFVHSQSNGSTGLLEHMAQVQEAANNLQEIDTDGPISSNLNSGWQWSLLISLIAVSFATIGLLIYIFRPLIKCTPNHVEMKATFKRPAPPIPYQNIPSPDGSEIFTTSLNN